MSTDFHSEPTMYANPAYRPDLDSYQELPDQLAYSEELPDQASFLHRQKIKRSSRRNGAAVAAGLIAGVGATALVLTPFFTAEPVSESDRSAVVVPGVEANPAPAPAPVIGAPDNQPASDPIAGAAGGNQAPANRPASGPASVPAGNRQAPAPGNVAVDGPPAPVDDPRPELPELPSLRDLIPRSPEEPAPEPPATADDSDGGDTGSEGSSSAGSDGGDTGSDGTSSGGSGVSPECGPTCGGLDGGITLDRGFDGGITLDPGVVTGPPPQVEIVHPPLLVNPELLPNLQP